MASRTFRIKNYYVFMGSKLLATAGIGTPQAVPIQVLVHCLGEGGESLAIFFVNPDRQVANTDPDGLPGRVEITTQRVRAEMFTSTSQYPWYLDLLRNEDPVFGYMDDTSPHMTRIWCNEPVGEGEMFP